MHRRVLMRLATIQLLLLFVLSCVPEATAPVLDSSSDLTTLSHQDGDEDSYAKVKGVIAEIDYDAMRLRLGDAWFWADGDTKIKIDDFEGTPTFADLGVDDPVHIEHSASLDEDKGYYAKEIKVVDDDDDDDDEVKYAKTEGYVEEVDADGMRFRMGEEMWFWVDGDTQYCDDDDDEEHDHLACSFDDIQVGIWVKVKHSMELEDDRGYYAHQVVVKPNHESEWAEGYVEEVDADGMRFRIGEEMWFWVDENTEYCDDDDDDDHDHLICSFDDVQVGVWVKTKYLTFMHEDRGLYAWKVLVKPNRQFEWAEGYVEEVDADGMRFRIGEDMWFWVDENTEYCDDDDEDDEECWSFDDILVGVWAKVKHRTFIVEDRGYYAKNVHLKFEHESVEGEVAEIDAHGLRIRVGDDWYWTDEHTEIEIEDFVGDPTFGNIESGDLVKIEHRVPAHGERGFYAKKIEVKTD